MSFVPAIKTTTGKKQIDYSSMANKPNTLSTITVYEQHHDPETSSMAVKNITATKDLDTLRIQSGSNIEFEAKGNEVTIHNSISKNKDKISKRMADDIFDSFILSDETREKHGVESSATVDDVLQEIKKGHSVGTLKHSILANLGDDWLLCDGGSFNTSLYPQLAQIYSGTLPSITANCGYVYIKAR